MDKHDYRKADTAPPGREDPAEPQHHEPDDRRQAPQRTSPAQEWGGREDQARTVEAGGKESEKQEPPKK